MFSIPVATTRLPIASTLLSGTPSAVGRIRILGHQLRELTRGAEPHQISTFRNAEAGAMDPHVLIFPCACQFTRNPAQQAGQESGRCKIGTHIITSVKRRSNKQLKLKFIILIFINHKEELLLLKPHSPKLSSHPSYS